MKIEDFRNRALGNTLRPDDVDANDYAAVYYAGGHGTMWDFPEAIDLGKVASQTYRNEGAGLSCLSRCCRIVASYR